MQIPSRHVRLLHVDPAAHASPSIGQLRSWGQEFGKRGRDVELLVARGDPVDRIVEASGDADLIVMATREPGILTRLRTENTADRVARRASTPALIVRGERQARMDPPVRIVVPLDGSPQAEEALPVAVKLGDALSLPLHLIRVVNQATILVGSEVWFREASDYLTSVIRSLAGRTPSTTSDIRFGPVAASLRDAIEPNDFVVMVTRGRGGLRRWLLGSVAARLVEWSDAPVVLVRAGTPASQIVTAPPVGFGERLQPRSPVTLISTDDLPA
jgi:nucleotide-binding universal stress UspA family protein